MAVIWSANFRHDITNLLRSSNTKNFNKAARIRKLVAA